MPIPSRGVEVQPPPTIGDKDKVHLGLLPAPAPPLLRLPLQQLPGPTPSSNQLYTTVTPRNTGKTAPLPKGLPCCPLWPLTLDHTHCPRLHLRSDQGVRRGEHLPPQPLPRTSGHWLPRVRAFCSTEAARGRQCGELAPKFPWNPSPCRRWGRTEPSLEPSSPGTA